MKKRTLFSKIPAVSAHESERVSWASQLSLQALGSTWALCCSLLKYRRQNLLSLSLFLFNFHFITHLSMNGMYRSLTFEWNFPKAICTYQWCRNWGGQGGHWPPQYLADQLTLFQPGVGRLCPPLPLAPPKFFTFRHHCTIPNSYEKIELEMQGPNLMPKADILAW